MTYYSATAHYGKLFQKSTVSYRHGIVGYRGLNNRAPMLWYLWCYSSLWNAPRAIWSNSQNC